jgi:hypothetical protein
MIKKFFKGISAGFIVAGVWIATLAYMIYDKLEEK